MKTSILWFLSFLLAAQAAAMARLSATPRDGMTNPSLFLRDSESHDPEPDYHEPRSESYYDVEEPDGQQIGEGW
ncbi:hypothetical protein BDW59DRAFT_161809 [Aspergillus cavernicola]|uniref:Secreted protein n=1 Tax=Aspergillus cavernicola TaxID=176166 RepID=A0ABR4IC90_9EURO